MADWTAPLTLSSHAGTLLDLITSTFASDSSPSSTGLAYLSQALRSSGTQPALVRAATVMRHALTLPLSQPSAAKLLEPILELVRQAPVLA